MYPRIVLSESKLRENIAHIDKLCIDNHISSWTLVSKAFAGNKKALQILQSFPMVSIGDSRIDNLKRLDPSKNKRVLLRIPSKRELPMVLKYADVSLESEFETISLLNQLAKEASFVHQIILMFDMGDLREGIFFQNIDWKVIDEIFAMESIQVVGIGTNLTCFGGVLPSQKNLLELVEIASTIEMRTGKKIPLISGGNSSSVWLFGKDEIPSRINHLRIGEAYLFGRETAMGGWIEDMNHDVFHLECEVIELKEKPSFPIGQMGMDSFGVPVSIEDRGTMKRAIVNIGKQDVILTNLHPKNKKLSIIGGSSDHLILEVRDQKLRLGDIVKFEITYPALVHLMSSNYIHKHWAK